MPFALFRSPPAAVRAPRILRAFGGRLDAWARPGRTLALLIGALAALASSAAAQAPEFPRGPQYALALGSRPKYPANFTHFDYANPKAPKGGTLTLPGEGGFDTLNPFTLKGRPPGLLAGLVFETLTDTSQDENRQPP